MCGLVGIASVNALAKHRQCLSLLLFLDTLRGQDSTGVASIRSDRTTEVLKSTIPGTEFIQDRRFDSHLKLTDTVWIGHNRFGTVGKNIRANAHPFMVLDDQDRCELVGAHNGTIKNRWEIENYSDFGTDSEALFHDIAKRGVKEALENIEGAWALTWYDHRDDRLKFIKNSERPLFYAYEKDKKSIIWASRSWMIRAATYEADIELENEEVFKVEDDTLLTFKIPRDFKEAVSLESKEGGLEGKKTLVGFFQGQTTSHHSSYWESQMQKHKQEKEQERISKSGTPKKINGGSQEKKSENSSEASSTVTSLLTYKSYKGYLKKPLSKTELQKQLSQGCAWCEIEDIAIGDKFAWLDTSKPVCSKCLTGVPEKEVNFYSTPSTKIN